MYSMRSLEPAALVVILTTVGACLAVSRDGSVDAGASTSKLRVGTYDNRAIAVAFATSKYNEEWLRTMRSALNEAKEAGNTARLQELEARAAWRQRHFHRQGFGRTSVSDLLVHIQERLPHLARTAQVDLITWAPDYVAEGVEVVDVTHLLVEQFEPSPRTSKTIADLRQRPPIPLEDLDGK